MSVDPEFKLPLNVLLDNAELGASRKKLQVAVGLLKAWEFPAQRPALKLFGVS